MFKKEKLSKKFIVLSTLIIINLISSFFISTVEAKGPDTPYVESGKVLIAIEGEPINISKELGEAYIDSQNRTMIPLRLISEKMGHKIKWNDKDRIVTVENQDNDYKLAIKIENSLLRFQPGEQVKEQEMDTSAVIKNGRTYVPARFPLEALGHGIQWSKSTGGGHYIDIKLDSGIIPNGKDADGPVDRPDAFTVTENQGEKIVHIDEDGMGTLTLVKDEFPKDFPELEFGITSYEGSFIVWIENSHVLEGYDISITTKALSPWDKGNRNWNKYKGYNSINGETKYYSTIDKESWIKTNPNYSLIQMSRHHIGGEYYDIESGQKLIEPKQYEKISIETTMLYEGKKRVYRLDSFYNKEDTWTKP